MKKKRMLCKHVAWRNGKAVCLREEEAYTNHFDEVEAYTDFTLWDEVKFWGSILILTLAIVAIFGEVSGLVDWFFNWLDV